METYVCAFALRYDANAVLTAVLLGPVFWARRGRWRHLKTRPGFAPPTETWGPVLTLTLYRLRL